MYIISILGREHKTKKWGDGGRKDKSKLEGVGGGEGGGKEGGGWQEHEGVSLLDELFHFTGDGQLMTQEVQHGDQITPLD